MPHTAEAWFAQMNHEMSEFRAKITSRLDRIEAAVERMHLELLVDEKALIALDQGLADTRLQVDYLDTVQGEMGERLQDFVDRARTTPSSDAPDPEPASAPPRPTRAA